MSWRLIAGNAFAGVDASSMAFCSRSRFARSMSSMLPSIIRSKLRWSRSGSGSCFVGAAFAVGFGFAACAGLFFFRR